MKEIEAKILEVDPAEIRRKMQEMNAEKKFEGKVQSEFYDYEDGRIEENGILRLRRLGSETILTRKTDEENQDGAKVMEEIEFEVGDMDEARALLTSLGLEQIHSSEKTRAKWHHGRIEYVIDWYPDIPALLEIEAPTQQELTEAIEDLGYNPDEAKDWDSHDLYQHYDAER
ncbi:CYTH domain-containing protein [Candidatus Nanohaloarchaea archaeon]|nr:CYTH domain-containing protein [Candidatus Nanohaloarchaea archaeon]